MQKKWLIRTSPNSEKITQLSNELKVQPIVAEMLLQRDITTFEEARLFFRPSLEDLHDPFLMKDMDSAVQRLKKAIDSKESILIYGDYDVDGTTSVAMVYDYLSHYHENIAYYIPDRYKEGYGLSEAGVRYASESGVSLIITLDCGVKAVEKIALAKSLGVDVIVCDHHTPGEQLPDGIILDPKREDCDYPYKELSGCGVGFKLLTAISTVQNWNQDLLFSYLDLLTISIAADIVPITGENRSFCQFGLQQINTNPRLAIKKMLDFAKKPLPLTLTNLVFIIAPRINAAGRLGDAKNAVKLLLEKSNDKAEELAKEIHDVNEERKGLDEATTIEALDLLSEDSNHSNKVTNVVFKSGWHKGVIGIVASRIIETHYRPTVVLTQPNKGDLLTGSVRSIKGIDVHEVLEDCSGVLEQFGGHYFAAGLSLKEENYNEFCQLFEKAVQERITDEMLIPEQKLERKLNFDEIYTIGEPLYELPRLKRVLQQFEPHGPGNMKPVFLSENVYGKTPRLLKEKHVKLTLIQPNNRVELDAIIFNRPEVYDLVKENQPLDIVYTLEVNEWQGRKMLQLNVKDIRQTEILVS